MVKFESEWQDFRESVLPKSVSQIQLSETKKAFYSGALAVISLTARMFSNEQEVTEEDVNSYDKLVNEIVSVCKSFTSEHEMN